MIDAIASIFSAYLVFYCYKTLSPVFPIPLVAFVPFFAVLLARRDWTVQLLSSALFSIGLGLLVFKGFESYGTWAYVLATVFFATQYFLFSLVVCFLSRRVANFLVLPLLCSTAYIVIDYCYANVYLAPTGRIAATLSYDTEFLSVVSLTGHSGLSFFIIFTNLVFTLLLLDLKKWRNHIPGALIVITVFFSIYLFGHSIKGDEESHDDDIELAIIQGGITKQQYEDMSLDFKSWSLVRDRYFSMTREASRQGHRNILWPETALRSYLGMKSEIRDLLNELPIALVGGFPVRDRKLGVQTNSALWLNRDAEIIARYDKNHLLPVSESEFVEGRNAEPIDVRFKNSSSNVLVATPLCFEILFPDFVRGMVNRGAELILVLTNDAGFGKTNISALVQKQAVLRAVENNRFLVRVAQSGISSVVSNSGKVYMQSNVMESGIFPATVRVVKETTFYNSFGEWFILLTVVCSVLSLRFRRIATR